MKCSEFVKIHWIIPKFSGTNCTLTETIYYIIIFLITILFKTFSAILTVVSRHSFKNWQIIEKYVVIYPV